MEDVLLDDNAPAGARSSPGGPAAPNGLGGRAPSASIDGSASLRLQLAEASAALDAQRVVAHQLADEAYRARQMAEAAEADVHALSLALSQARTAGAARVQALRSALHASEQKRIELAMKLDALCHSHGLHPQNGGQGCEEPGGGALLVRVRLTPIDGGLVRVEISSTPAEQMADGVDPPALLPSLPEPAEAITIGPVHDLSELGGDASGFLEETSGGPLSARLDAAALRALAPAATHSVSAWRSFFEAGGGEAPPPPVGSPTRREREVERAAVERELLTRDKARLERERDGAHDRINDLLQELQIVKKLLDAERERGRAGAGSGRRR